MACLGDLVFLSALNTVDDVEDFWETADLNGLTVHLVVSLAKEGGYGFCVNRDLTTAF